MDLREIRLRCIEAAARNPVSHVDGFAAGVQASATLWFNWIISEEKGAVTRPTLGVPIKSGRS